MGAETSVVVALFFIGFLVVAAAVYLSGDYSENLVKKAQVVQDTMNKAKMQTDITITNISYTNISYSGSCLNITLKNTGKTTLNASQIEIFIDGVYYATYTLSPPGNTLAPEKSTNISFYGIIAQDATITIDNTGKKNSSGSSTKLNITTFAVGSGTNRLLVVGVNYYTNPGTTNVTYNNTVLTRAMIANNGIYYAELWYLINPPSGSSNINQTQTTATQVVMGAWSYTGVDQVTGIGNITNATGNSIRSNVNITTTAANSVLVDVNTEHVLTSPFLTIGPGQTQRYKDTSLGNIDGSGSDMSTSNIGIYNMNWTLYGVGSAWVNIAAEIKPHNGLTGARIKIVTENGISDYTIAP